MDFVPAHKLAAISKEARRLAWQLSEGAPVYFQYEPGNFTTYRMVLCLDSLVVNKPEVGLGGNNSLCLLISLLDFNTMLVCDMSASIDSSYVANKLGVTIADGQAIAYLLNETRHYHRH